LFPQKEFITDNAAMIGLAGYLNYKLLKKKDELFSLDSQSNFKFLKIMKQVAKIYDSKKYEKKIYSLWEKINLLKLNLKKTKSNFSIIMPPPNANDPLHTGHAIFLTIEDILIRYHRMANEVSLWLPGADHAGIETQYVFEKN